MVTSTSQKQTYGYQDDNSKLWKKCFRWCIKQVNREACMGTRRYGISLRAFNSISNEGAHRKSEVSSWTGEKRNSISPSNHVLLYTLTHYWEEEVDVIHVSCHSFMARNRASDVTVAAAYWRSKTVNALILRTLIHKLVFRNKRDVNHSSVTVTRFIRSKFSPWNEKGFSPANATIQSHWKSTYDTSRWNTTLNRAVTLDAWHAWQNSKSIVNFHVWRYGIS